MTDPFTTERFTTSPAVYLRCLLGMWFKHYGLWVALPLMAAAILGLTADLRFLIVMLMMIFLMLPMLLSYIYFYYMLAPEARRAILPMEVTLRHDGSLLIIYQPDDTDNPHSVPHPPETISAEAIRRVTKWRDYRALILQGPRLNFILIPEKAIRSDNHPTTVHKPNEQIDRLKNR